MYTRELALKIIVSKLTYVSTYVKNLNRINLNDASVSSEDFLISLFNFVYKDRNFKSSNVKNDFNKGFDLIDTVDSCVYQITTDNSSTKIKNTIKSYLERPDKNNFSNLRIFIFGYKKKYRSDFAKYNETNFKLMKQQYLT